MSTDSVSSAPPAMSIGGRLRKISPVTGPFTPPRSATSSTPVSRKSSNTEQPSPACGGTGATLTPLFCNDIMDNRHTESLSERIEHWLDDHPEFVKDYFARKGTRETVEAWMVAHTFHPQNQPLVNSSSNPGIDAATSSPTSSTVGSSESRLTTSCTSGNSTPVRKISAHEFFYVGSKPILVTGSNGSPTFIKERKSSESGVAYSSSGGSHIRTSSSFGPPVRRRRSEIRQLDERELMHELVLDICNDLEPSSLCFKILQNICLLLRADRCSLFLVQDDRSTRNGKVLVSELFDVTENSTLEQSKQNSQENSIRVPLGTGIMGHVAQTGEFLNIKDAYQDPRFNKEIDRLTGYRTRSILCMPLKDAAGEVLGVAQVVNKADQREEPFTDKDVKVFDSYLAFCGIGLRNAQLYQQSELETRRNQVLLDLARLIFEEQSELGKLIAKIMVHTQSLLQCQRCQVLLLDDLDQDKGMFSHAYDLCTSDFDENNTYIRENNDEPRFPINIGITGYVAKTGDILNISDAYLDDKFDKSVDEGSDFRHTAILCMPTFNSKRQVLGVIQLVNKVDGGVFTLADQNLLEALALFCGLGIHNTQMMERTIRAMAKQRVALEVLSYHAIASVEEAQKLKKMLIPSTRYYKLTDFSFTDFSLSDDDTLKACLRMFIDLDMVAKFRIPYSVMCRWLLSVKKNYRNVTYHNWRHAFNVAQTMFAIIKSTELNKVLSDLDCMSMLIACLCHDLDHRGTNNQFQIKTSNPLADLYSTSVLEHHHFDQCVMILTTKGNDILSQMEHDEYERVIQGVEQSILATDLARYFSRRTTFFSLVGMDSTEPMTSLTSLPSIDQASIRITPGPDWTVETNIDLLRSMLMTACDVAAIAKPWPVQKKIAELVANEFFEQGDIEKSELKITPVAMMDRDKRDQLPLMQVGFIDSICLPIYKAIVFFSPHLQPLFDGCLHNRQQWESMSKDKH